MVMLTKEQVLEQVSARLNRLLLVAELCLSEKQFTIFRKMMLDEFGRNGLGRDLERLGADGGAVEGRSG
jgi:hypothetical protein